MVCERKLRPAQSPAERKAEVDAALRLLESRIASGAVRVVVGQQGAVALGGWRDADRRGLTDACAVRALVAAGSWDLRQALQRAEALAGRKISEQAMTSGQHSHDGGATWHPSH